MAPQTLLTTNISEYPLFRCGKVRDIYDLGDSLLFVATDRISAFDVVLPNGIPGKGEVLTQMSLFWYSFLRDIIGNHLISASIDSYPLSLRKYRDILERRSMIVSKARRVDVECIVRGYLAGSLWKELVTARKGGSSELLGFAFHESLVESSKLPEPIFSPSTKNDSGHDINISFAEMVALVGKSTAEQCREKAIACYSKAADYALSRGIIIADTKFEFGYVDDALILIDEVLSPDSSRFWPASEYEPGGTQVSFDKQPIRDYLETIVWDKKPPGPVLPDSVVQAAVERYRKAQRLLIGG